MKIKRVNYQKEKAGAKVRKEEKETPCRGLHVGAEIQRKVLRQEKNLAASKNICAERKECSQS